MSCTVILSDKFLISSYLDKCPNEHITPYGKSLYNEILKKDIRFTVMIS